ncbi:hypothetical protein [Pseudanabaena sp. PCC 6802]|uniref:hypothetical protein n=1 Tax=Pseudanabaena sp. PCC 6802 TaxID=118173 RepID=UPI00034B2382|nr:hypothetical protein [Pseudanabaena sp. PCC 6802]
MGIFDPGEDYTDPELTESRYEDYGALGQYRTRVYDGNGQLPITPWIPGLDNQRYLMPDPFAPNPNDDDATADVYRTKCETCVVVQWRNIGRWTRNPFGILVLVTKAIPVYSCTRRPECRDRGRDRDDPKLPPEPKIPKGWGLRVWWGWWIQVIVSTEYWANPQTGERGEIKRVRRQYTYGSGINKIIEVEGSSNGAGIFTFPLENVNGQQFNVLVTEIVAAGGKSDSPFLSGIVGYNGYSGGYFNYKKLTDVKLLAVERYILNPLVRQQFPSYFYNGSIPSDSNGYANEEFNNTHELNARMGYTFWDEVKRTFARLRQRKFTRPVPNAFPYREEEFDLYTDWFRPNGIPYLFGLGNWAGRSMYWSVIKTELLPPSGSPVNPKDNGHNNPNGEDPMSCCEEQSDLLRAIYKRLGCDQYPIEVPETLVPNDDTEKGKTQQIEDLTNLVFWEIKQLDALTGQFPIEIEIPAAPEVGVKEQKLKFPNIAESLAEIVGLLVPNSVDNNIAIDLINRLFTEVIAAKNAAIIGQDLAYANSEYLGYKIKQITRDVPSSVNLEKLGTYKDFAKEGNYKLVSWENVDKNTAQSFFSKLMFSASIIKEVFFVSGRKDPKGRRIQQTLKDVQGNAKETENNWAQYLDDPLDQGKKDKDRPKIIEKNEGVIADNPLGGGAGS